MTMTRFERWDLEGSVCELNQSKAERIAKQRALRADQYQIVAERAAAGIQPMWCDYRDTRGWLGVDRYIQSITAMHRASRRAPEHTPWQTLLEYWTPDKRCHDTFARNTAGEVVHHDDPTATRWCLGGWLAHRCMKQAPWREGHTADPRTPWWTLTDDRDAKRLLDEVWALVPERTRAIVERAWRDRVSAKDRKRIDQHQLGYWWYLAPHLAARFLRIDPSQTCAQPK